MASYEERLIELVRNHPVLYDTSHSQYLKSKLKSEIWTKIAKDLDLKNGDEVKSAWVKLRNNHRDALRRQRRIRRSGIAGVHVKPWKFQAQMEFLLRYMVNEDRDMNFADEDDRSELPSGEGQCGEPEIHHDVDDSTHVVYDEESVLPSTSQDKECNSIDSSANNEPCLSPKPLPPPTKKKRKFDFETFLKNSIEQREQRSKQRSEERKKLEEENSKKDDLYHFYMSMYEQTKKMPPTSQHIVRRNVFHAVFEEEARLLNIHEVTSPVLRVFPPSVETSEIVNNAWTNNSPNRSQRNSPSPSTSSSGQPTYHSPQDSSNDVNIISQ